MKFLTSPLYCLKQLSKLSLLICLGSFSTKAISIDNPPGIVESYERLVELHNTQYQDIDKEVSANVQIISSISNLKDFQIEPNFMRSLLLSSDEKYLNLTQKDECHFYATLENNLLRTSAGEIKSIFITFKDRANIKQTAAVPVKDFFTEVYKRKCYNNKEFSTLFNLNNVKKTIEGIKFSIPKNQKECNQIHHEWLVNSYSPYLCQIHKILQGNSDDASFYRKSIAVFQRTYIENLCNNLNSADQFCQNYLKEDIWNKVMNGEAPLYKMSYKCKNLFSENEVLNKATQAACAVKLNTNPQLCQTKGTKNFPSLFPMFTCDLLSQALVKSKLITDYHDCPGNIDNEMLTNIHRIIYHFDPEKIESTKENCAGETYFSIAKLFMAVKNETEWPLNICFFNHIEGKETCKTYIPGTHANQSKSEDFVVAKILYEQKGAPKKITCKVVDTKTYNPLLSNYKMGCFIVYDAESCKNMACNKKVIWDQKVMEDIKFNGRPIFEYYPTNYLNQRFSLTSLLNEVKRMQSRSIKNLTDLMFYLDKIPGSIIHGVGCAEDLLPEQYSRISINECHPLPFIIDGYVKKNNNISLVFRSAIDDIHSPRLIAWNNIFNSVTAYQPLHPLSTWTLNGLKK